MTDIKTIPLHHLIEAEVNVRHQDKEGSIKPLMASIEAHGLLNPLVVRPANPDLPSEDGDTYEVIAGRRRLMALRQLARKGKIPFDYPVSCTVIEMDAAQALAVSLAENFTQLPMNPVAQWRAFRALLDQDRSVKAIAKTFGVSERFVAQRLALSALAPEALERVEAGTMDLEVAQVMTRLSVETQQTLVKERGQALQVWDVKRAIDRTSIPFENAIFPLDQYNGGFLRDLFGTGKEKALQAFADVEQFWLLQNAAIERRLEELRAEGWRSAQRLPEDWPSWRIRAARGVLTAEQQAHIAELQADHDRLEATDEPDWEALGSIEDKIEEIEQAAGGIDKAANDVWLHVHRNGRVETLIGVDREAERKEDGQATLEDAGADATPKPKREMTDAMDAWMQRQRKAMVTSRLSANPDHAMTVLAAKILVQSVQLRLTPWAPAYNLSDDLPLSRAEQAVAIERRDLQAVLDPLMETDSNIRFGSDWTGESVARAFRWLLNKPDLVSWILARAAADILTPDEPLLATVAEALSVGWRDGEWWAPTVAFFDAIKSKDVLLAMLAELVDTLALEDQRENARLTFASKTGKQARHWLVGILVNRQFDRFFPASALDAWRPRWLLGGRYFDPDAPAGAEGAAETVGEVGVDVAGDGGVRGEDSDEAVVAAE